MGAALQLDYMYHYAHRRNWQPHVVGGMLTLAKVVSTRFWMPLNSALLDPVVTSSEELLRFEGFSSCCGVYARADLEAPTFDAEVQGRGASDLNGDGRADIIVGAGPSAGPHAKAFDAVDRRELLSFYAYAQSFSGGIFVTGLRPSGGSALRLADAPASGVFANLLSDSQLQTLRAEALDRWQDAGLSRAQLDQLRSVSFSIADLPGNLLGLARGNNIAIDREPAAAGSSMPRPAAMRSSHATASLAHPRR